MELEIKRIQDILVNNTQPAAAVEPRVDENAEVLKAIKQFNNLFKK